MALKPDELSESARQHLWMHFTRLSSYEEHEVPVMVRGQGSYVWDSHGKKYLDGLAGLFVVQAGHGRTELAEAAGKQASELAYFPLWSYAHQPAVELADKLASLAPGDINRVFFTTGGSEAVESAWKLARQYFKLMGKPEKTKVLSRNLAYHGTTFGALSITGLPGIKTPFEPLVPGGVRVQNTNHYRCPDCANSAKCNLTCADDIEQTIEYEGAESIAAIYLEPVQNSGGCFVPEEGYFQRVRELCDANDILLVSDEVICAFGRLGHWFGSERFGYQPDIITTAKGMTSGYSPIGGMLASERLVEPFLKDTNSFLHGITFAGHPVSAAVALANLELFERDQLLEHVRAKEGEFRSKLETLSDIPIVGEIRGAGFFYGIELVKDRATRETFNDEESERLLRGILTPTLFESGLICRADDRGDPVVQLSPPLVADTEEFDTIVSILRDAFEAAAAQL